MRRVDGVATSLILRRLFFAHACTSAQQTNSRERAASSPSSRRQRAGTPLK